MTTRISDLQSPRQVVAALNRWIEANAVEIETMIATAEREQRSDLSRREQVRYDELLSLQQELQDELVEAKVEERRSMGVPQIDRSSGGVERPTVLLDREQRISGRFRVDQRDSSYDAGEVRSFSLGAAVQGLVTGDWRGAEVERRALSQGTNSAGGYLVPSPIATSVIDRVRNQSRVIEAGAQTVPMDENTLGLPRLATGVSGAWRNENAAVAESDAVFERVTLTARTLAVLTRLSYELFQDLTPAGAEIIERELIQSLAVELDRVALRGTGTAPEPRGVLNTSGVTTITNGANGTAFGWAQVVNLLATVQANGFDPNAIIANPRAVKSAALLVDTTNQPLVAPSLATSVEMLLTKQVPITLTTGSSSDTSELYAGDWSQLVIGFRPQVSISVQRTGGPEGMIGIKASQERYMDTMQIGVIAFLRADIGLLHPEAFAVSTGIRP